MNQSTQGGTAPQPGTPSPATAAPANANNTGQNPSSGAGQSATQQAMNFVHAVLTGDTNGVNEMIAQGETHVVSLALDFVPPTYRGKVQPFVDSIVNSTQGAVLNIADKEIGIGLAIAKARLGGILAFF